MQEDLFATNRKILDRYFLVEPWGDNQALRKHLGYQASLQNVDAIHIFAMIGKVKMRD